MKKKTKKQILDILIVLCLIVMVISGYFLFDDYSKAQSQKKEIAQIQEIKKEATQTQGNAGSTNAVQAPLEEINPDYVGWITIKGTNIDYPIVQGNDNDYYLFRTFYKEKSKYGSIYLDYRHSLTGNFKAIYGHHMKDGQMFGALAKYKSVSFRDSHPTVTIETETQTLEYTVFAVMEVSLDAEEGFGFDYITMSNREDYLNTLQQYAIYYSEPGQDILVLSTCSYVTKDARLVVFASR